MSDVAERVKKIVVEHLGVEADKVTDNASFIDDLGADSLMLNSWRRWCWWRDVAVVVALVAGAAWRWWHRGAGTVGGVGDELWWS